MSEGPWRQAWTPAQEEAYDLKAEYDEAMRTVQDAWLLLTPDQRADPEIANRFSQMNQELAETFRERYAETMSTLSPPA